MTDIDTQQFVYDKLDDMEKEVILIRGIPGTGKSTLGARLVEGALSDGQTATLIEADDYFINDDGSYTYVAEDIQLAHDYCLDKFVGALDRSVNLVVVANTFVRIDYLTPYITEAQQHGYNITTYICTTLRPNVHNIQAKTVRRMRSRFEWPRISVEWVA